ncbi:MAG: GNAT family N-acetyltransferase [Ignavibacteriaceae bacterium]|nr:GNAT family N-acetyltransferase [Ignavibacteriaceae bacterium]
MTGILPLAQVKNFFSGSKLISFPLTTHCEPLVEEEQLKKIYDRLISGSGKNDFVELRSLDYSCNMEGASLNEDFVIHLLELEETEEKTFQNFHETSVKALIKKNEKNNLKFEIDNSTVGLKAFYSLFSDLRKRLGLPIPPYKIFNSIFTNLVKDDRILIPIVKHDGFVVAAGFILKFKDTFYIEYTASNNSKLNLYPNQKLYWEIIKTAIKDGAKFIDFGRAKKNHNSLITFKERWNAKKKKLRYWRIGNKLEAKSSDGNSKSVFVKINKHLPKSILKLEGKILYKYNG